MIPYGRQEITQADIDAVVAVLRSDYLTQGPAVPAFEQAVAQYCQVPYALAFNSATSALHAACLALGVGPGDLVWTSPITFVASANCALYCGADIDFVDIDVQTYNLDVELLRQKLQQTKASGGRLPKVVIPVHLCGHACDMAAIAELAQEYGFRVIEDASHAIGGHYRERPVGGCDYSDITVFSFHPVKIITTGEGGMTTTRDAKLHEKLSLLRSHGITRDPAQMTQPADGPWYYQQIMLGYNYRMTDMQAALGSSQMQRLEQHVQARQQLRLRYQHALRELPLTLPTQLENVYSAWHLYVVLLPEHFSTEQHRSVFEQLREQSIGVNLHYIPVHMQPYYQTQGFKHGDFPVAEAYYRRAISLPLFHHLSLPDQDKVITVLTRILNAFG